MYTGMHSTFKRGACFKLSFTAIVARRETLVCFGLGSALQPAAGREKVVYPAQQRLLSATSRG